MAKPPKNTSTAPAKESKPAVKTQTLSEFRAWLSGVEEMQSDNWSPDLTQWRRIRERIENIIDNPRSFKSGGAGPSQDYEQPVVVRPAGPSAFAGVPSMPQPIAATPPPFMNTSDAAGARISTPNVDTSNQPYASSLE